jgi:hypothetical protein
MSHQRWHVGRNSGGVCLSGWPLGYVRECCPPEGTTGSRATAPQTPYEAACVALTRMEQAPRDRRTEPPGIPRCTRVRRSIHL